MLNPFKHKPALAMLTTLGSAVLAYAASQFPFASHATQTTAQPITCRVVGIADGDTLLVSPSKSKPSKFVSMPLMRLKSNKPLGSRLKSICLTWCTTKLLRSTLPTPTATGAALLIFN